MKRDFDGFDAAHLSGADSDGLSVFGNDDSVGFDVFDDGGSESQVIEFFGAWLTCSHVSQGIFVKQNLVGALNQESAVDGMIFKRIALEVLKCD